MKKGDESRFCEVCLISIAAKRFAGHRRSNAHKEKCLQNVEEEDGVFKIASGFKNAVANYRVSLRDGADVPSSLQHIKHKVESIVSKLLDVHGRLKFGLELFVDFVRTHEDQLVSSRKSFITRQHIITLNSDFHEIYNSMCNNLEAKIEEAALEGSGWSYNKALYLEVNINKYNPIGASSYIQLPPAIENKHACINVKNDDNRCFAWAIFIDFKRSSSP